MRMTGADFRDASPNVTPEPIPGHARALAASAKRAQPCPADLGAERTEPFQVPGYRVVVQVPCTTRRSQAPISAIGAWWRFIRPCRTALGVARMIEAIVTRGIVKCGFIRVTAQMYVNPRKSNVSGRRCRRRPRRSIANCPNSRIRVFSSFSERPNVAIRSRSASRKRRASDFVWKPTTLSSAYRTTMTSSFAVLLRRWWIQRSKT